MDINKTHLVYFSPTGTTKKVLEAVSRGINYPISRVTDITPSEIRKQPILSMEDELVIIGAPVYGGRIQKDAARFFSGIRGGGCPAVLIAVYGNREYEDALVELHDIAVQSDLVPAALASFIGEHSFSIDNAPIGAGRPDSSDITAAIDFGRRVRMKLKSLSSPDEMDAVSVPGNRPYKDHLNLPVIEFIDTSDFCTRCNVCAEACPVSAIETDTIITDFTSCILCCACIKKCPESARSMGQGPIFETARKLSSACVSRKEPEFFL